MYIHPGYSVIPDVTVENGSKNRKKAGGIFALAGAPGAKPPKPRLVKPRRVRRLGLPSDEDTISAPSGVSHTKRFGRYSGDIPFGASKDKKFNAEIIVTRNVPLSEYDPGYEVVRSNLKFSDPIDNDEKVTWRVRWYDHETGKLLFTYTHDMPTPESQDYDYWEWYLVKSWIGNTKGYKMEEIEHSGTYRVEYDWPGEDFFTGHLIMYFGVAEIFISPGDTVTTEVKVKNTGTDSHNFGVETEYNSKGTECDDTGLISPNSTGWASTDWYTPSDLSSGYYDLDVDIMENSDCSGSQLDSVYVSKVIYVE